MSRLGILVALGAILLALFVLGMVSINFQVRYADGFLVAVRVLFIRIRLYPRKRKRPSKRNFKTKRFKKWINKNIARADKRAERAKRKAERKKAKKDKAKNKQTAGSNGGPGKRQIKPLIRMFTRIFNAFIEKFPRYLKTTVSRFVIGVGTDDAATTAIAYGYTVQAAQYAIEYIGSKTELRQAKNAAVSVYPDFTSDKYRIEMDVTFSLRIWQLISLGISVLMTYLGIGKHGAKKNDRKENKKMTPQKEAEDIKIS